MIITYRDDSGQDRSFDSSRVATVMWETNVMLGLRVLVVQENDSDATTHRIQDTPPGYAQEIEDKLSNALPA